MEATTTAAKNYNRWVLFGGRENVQQHLADLQKEEQLTRLLNIQKQRGFFTPQQDYAYRQREYQQLLLWNRAEMMGYQTPEQYLTYLQKERTAFEGMTKAWRDRDNAVASALSAMNTYASKFGAATLSPQQLSAANKALDAYQSNLAETPDQLRTAADLTGVALANRELDAYQLNLSQTPDTVNTFMSFDDGVALAKAMAYKRFLDSIPRVTITRLITEGPGFDGVAANLPPLHQTVDDKITYVPGGSLSDTQLGDINKNITLINSGSSALRNYALAAAMARMQSQGAAQSSGALAAAAGAAGGAATKAAGSKGGGGGGFWGWAGAIAAAGAAGNKWFSGGGWLGKVVLFGGASAIAGWHLFADALIEFAAVAVPAAIRAIAGLSAYAAASFANYMSIFNRFKAQFITTAATLQDMAPFAVNNKGKAVQTSTTTSLDFVADKVAPDAVQQLGDVLTLMKQQSGLISQLATTTGGVLDRFAARMVYDFTSGGSALHTLLSTGQRDLVMFGHLAQNIGSLFMEFVKATEITHVAEDLLGLLDVVTKLAAAVGHFIGPWGLAIGIGIHAAYVYGGLLVTAFKNWGASLLNAAKYVITLGTAIDKNGVQTNALQRAWAWLKTPTGTLAGIGLIVAAFGYLIVRLDDVKDATQKAAAALVNMVSHSTVYTLLPNLGSAISNLGDMMIGLEGRLTSCPQPSPPWPSPCRVAERSIPTSPG